MSTAFGFSRAAVLTPNATFSGSPGQGTLVLSQTSVSFSIPFQDTIPRVHVISLTSTGNTLEGPEAGTIVYDTGTGWITAFIVTATNVTIEVDATGLAAGTYTATAPVTDARASNSPADIDVELIVTSTAAAPVISFSAGTGDLYFTAPAGGPNPTPETLTISNEYGGLGALGTISVTGSAAWINPSYAAGLLTITPQMTSLAAGVYTGYVDVAATAAPTRRTPTIQLDVTPITTTALIVLTPSGRTQSATAGGANPANQTVTISNGTGVFGDLGAITLGTTTYSQGSGWLTATLSTPTPDTITLAYNIASLGTGTYNASVPVQAADAGNTPLGLQVTLSITGGGGGSAVIQPSFTLPTFLTWNTTLRRFEYVSGASHPTITMPAFHGGAADHSCGTHGQLVSALAACVDGDIIELTADLTGNDALLRNRGTAGWVWIRPSAHASLPAYTSDFMNAGSSNRVDPVVNAAHLKKIRVTGVNNHAFTCAPGARGYWITGIEMMPDSTHAAGNIIEDAICLLAQAGNIATSVEANLIRDIVIDRCYIHGNPADGGGNLSRGIWVDGERITVAHSVIRGISIQPIQGSEHQALNGLQWRDSLVFNNEIDGRTENIGPIGGGAGFIPITNYLSGNLAFIRNWCPKSTLYPTTWLKNWFEIKGATVVLLYGNHFFNYDMDPVQGQTRAFVLTPDQPSWSEIRDITVMCNIFEDCNGGAAMCSAQGSGSFINQGSSRVEWLHNAYITVANRGTFSLFGIQGGQQSNNWHYDSLHITHNLFGHWNAAFQNLTDLTRMLDFQYNNNVFANLLSFGPIMGTATNNQAALDTHAGVGNWQCGYNIFPTGSAPIGGGLLAAPHNNIYDAPANYFTDPTTGDYTIKAGSVYKARSTGGVLDPGPDWSLLNAATANVRP